MVLFVVEMLECPGHSVVIVASMGASGMGFIMAVDDVIDAVLPLEPKGVSHLHNDRISRNEVFVRPCQHMYSDFLRVTIC